MRKLLLAALAIVSIGLGYAVATNYTVTQGSGTTFGSLVVAGVNYAQQFICDATTPSQCGAVNGSGQIAIQAPPSLPLPSGAATSALQGTNSATTAHTCSTAGYSILGCLGQIDDDVKGAIPAGTNIIGKVGIDQTTPGTTNGVQVNAAIPAGTNVIGYTTPDPCSQGTKINTPITQTGTQRLFLATSAKKNYICSIFVIAADAENLSLVEGTGSLCGSSTAQIIGGLTAANGPNLAANGGFTLGNGLGTIAAGSNNNFDVCLFQSGSGRVAGNMTYVQQ